MGKRVLVTGASGFIGAHLCAALLRAGAEVHGLTRRSRVPVAGMHWWHVDCCDLEQLRGLYADLRPQIVYHLAGFSTGTRALEAVMPSLQQNLISSIHLMLVATELGCERLVLPGSLEAPQENNAIPSSPYAAAKGAMRDYAAMFHTLYKTPLVLARLFMVYGPAEHHLHKLVPYVCLALQRGEAPRINSGARAVDWIFVEDAINGLLALGLTPRLEGRSVDIGTGQMTTVREVVERLVNIARASVEPQFGNVSNRSMEQERVANVAETAALTGWRASVALDEGLRRSYEWYARMGTKTEREVGV
ncbi:MAG: NAD-dependent epimerase/dehydratase family protein [Chloroflexaceae bacterium]|nr:NAD-dependent epimerase/dehydratase family protein [Chloroflexaceae bacterium]